LLISNLISPRLEYLISGLSEANFSCSLPLKTRVILLE
jgi:hypothetical protein